MTDSLRPVLAVWFALVVISVGSWWIGNDHGLTRDVAALALIVLAFVKAGLVASHFMDLRNAPAGLARGMAAVLAVSATAIIGFYLFA